jgi:alpha-aminoadipic semialdehyde synthase
MLKGHLFDSGLINQVLDVLEANHCLFEFQECQVVRPRPYYYPEQENKDSTLLLQQQRSSLKSRAILKITTAKADGDDDDTTTTMQQQQVDNADTIFGIVESKIEALVAAIETADATFRRIDTNPSSPLQQQHDKNSTAAAVVQDQSEKTVLLLGSGRVSKSVVDWLGRVKGTRVIVASNDEDQAREVASYAGKRGRHVALDLSDQKSLAELVQHANVVISLLPVPMHPQIANVCIDQQTDMVTASYESEAMRQLDERAKNAGIILLNEVGLDPGLDHMRYVLYYATRSHIISRYIVSNRMGNDISLTISAGCLIIYLSAL